MYKRVLCFAVVILLSLAACGDNESSSSVNTGKTSEAGKNANDGSQGKEQVLRSSDSFSLVCRMKNEDSATVMRKLAIDYDGYGKMVAYTETAEYDESVSFEELREACETAMKNLDAEVSCEDNIIVSTSVVENVEWAEVKRYMKEINCGPDTEE